MVCRAETPALYGPETPALLPSELNQVQKVSVVGRVQCFFWSPETPAMPGPETPAFPGTLPCHFLQMPSPECPRREGGDSGLPGYSGPLGGGDSGLGRRLRPS